MVFEAYPRLYFVLMFLFLFLQDPFTFYYSFFFCTFFLLNAGLHFFFGLLSFFKDYSNNHVFNLFCSNLCALLALNFFLF